MLSTPAKPQFHLNICPRLHDEIVAYNAYISPTIQEIHARLQVIARIAEVVRRRYPYCTLETFGSTAQNLYLPDGYVSSAFVSIGSNGC